MTYDLDPELATLAEMLPETSLVDVDALRAMSSAMLKEFNGSIDETGVAITHVQVPSYGEPEITNTVRVYTPDNKPENAPGLLYIHGGGFVVGDLEFEHNYCIEIARRLDIVVVSVDYRLAPENPYPAAVNDCYGALLWFHQEAGSRGVDPERIAVFGQSAGGGLTAATVLMARDLNGPGVCFQFLGIPELDDRLDTASMNEFIDTPGWCRPNAELSWQYYLGDSYTPGSSDVPSWAAPAREEDLSNLPPTYLCVQQFDPLRDEGLAYARRLLECGVSTELHCYAGTFHGSHMLQTALVSQRQIDDMFEAVANGLGIPQKEKDIGM